MLAKIDTSVEAFVDTLLLEWHHDGRTHTYSVSAELTRIGRSTDCDIVLALPMISREHARIMREGGTWFLQIVSRPNQIRLDRWQLSDGQRVSLQEGDTFRIGSVDFVVAAPPQPAQPSGSRFKIICSACQQKVDYVPNGVCAVCGAPLADGMTVYSS